MGTPRAIDRRARASSAADRGRASAKRAASRAVRLAIWAGSGLRIALPPLILISVSTDASTRKGMKTSEGMKWISGPCVPPVVTPAKVAIGFTHFCRTHGRDPRLMQAIDPTRQLVCIP